MQPNLVQAKEILTLAYVEYPLLVFTINEGVKYHINPFNKEADLNLQNKLSPLCVESNLASQLTIN